MIKTQVGDTSVTEIIQIIITLAVVLTYCFLVIVDKASIEGFVAIATYVIKKFLDMIEEKEKPT